MNSNLRGFCFQQKQLLSPPQAVGYFRNKNDLENNYYLSVTDNDSGVMKEMYLNEKEYRVLDIAVRHNRGIINLLSEVEIIENLYIKGLVEISNDSLEIAVVSDVISFILDPKIRENILEDLTAEENRPNSLFKVFGNKSVCFCYL
ncbi:MAG: hypothetical protein PHY80_04255 [Rickettsiales bacterium]|nr:hypothetical protein [Rickettsiales bacterium]